MYAFKLKVARYLPLWQQSGFSPTHLPRLIYTSPSRPESNALDPDTFGQLGTLSKDADHVVRDSGNVRKTLKHFPGKSATPSNDAEYIASDRGEATLSRDADNFSQDGGKARRSFKEFPKVKYTQDISVIHQYIDSKFGASVESYAEDEIVNCVQKSKKKLMLREQGNVSSSSPLESLPEESVLEKWHDFQDRQYQEILKIQDDSEDYFNDYLFQKQAKKDIGRPPSRETSKTDEHQTVDSKEITSNRESKALEDNTQNGESQILPSPELFGTISPLRFEHETAVGDEGDRREEQFEEARLARKHTPQFYGQRMKNLCQERRLSEALHILEVEMPSVRAQPNDFCYNVLITACGRAGYTKKAFALHTQMKKRGLRVKGLTYTGLFNACANSPWPATDGLQRATKLRAQVIEKAYPMNERLSHVMIKAFGRCGDIKTAFQIVDEMVSGGLTVTTETLNFLLQACISDKTSGFRHAIMVWRKMRELKLSPDIYSYNLLIRCTAECQAGDPNLTSQLLHPPQKTPQRKDKMERKKVITEKVLLLDVESEAQNSDARCDSLDETIINFDNTRINSLDDIRQNRSDATSRDSEKTTNIHGDTTRNIDCSNDTYTQTNKHLNEDIRSKQEVINQNLEYGIESDDKSAINAENTRDSGSAFNYSNLNTGHKLSHPEERHYTELEVRRELDGGGEGAILPDILGRTITPGAVVGLGALDEPQDRLSLVGGLVGLVKQMVKDKVQPDIKTVTQLVSSLPSQTTTEEALLRTLKEVGLKPDTQFCNMLIRKRNLRGDNKAATATLEIMQDHHLVPDLITYGCLALGCHHLPQATQLLKDMDQADFRPNLEIMRILTKNGLVRANFFLTLEMLREMSHREYIVPDSAFLDNLERGRVRARDLLRRQEEPGGKRETRQWVLDGARQFLLEYKTWLKKSQVQLPDHPWDQFKPQPEQEGHGSGQGGHGFGQEWHRSGQGKYGSGQGGHGSGQGRHRSGQGGHGSGQGTHKFGQGGNGDGQMGAEVGQGVEKMRWVRGDWGKPRRAVKGTELKGKKRVGQRKV